MVNGSFHGLIEARVPKSALTALSQQAPSGSCACRRAGSRTRCQARRSRRASPRRYTPRASPARARRSRSSTAASPASPPARPAGDLPANVVTQDMCGGDFGERGGPRHRRRRDRPRDGARRPALPDLLRRRAHLAAAEAYVEDAAASRSSTSRSSSSTPAAARTTPPTRSTRSCRTPARTASSGSTRPATTLTRTGRARSADTERQRLHGVRPGGRGQHVPVAGRARRLRLPALGRVAGGHVGLRPHPLRLGDRADHRLVRRRSERQSAARRATSARTQRKHPAGAWAIRGAHVTSSPRLDFVTNPIPPPYLQYQSAAGSIGDPASSPSAFAVGALCWQNNALEGYSSQGPTSTGA